MFDKINSITDFFKLLLSLVKRNMTYGHLILLIIAMLIFGPMYISTTLETIKLSNQHQLNMIDKCATITGSMIECPGGIKITK